MGFAPAASITAGVRYFRANPLKSKEPYTNLKHKNSKTRQ